MEQVSVIPVVVAVVLCIVCGVICWYLSQMHHRQTRTPTQLYQWQVPEDTVSPQGLAPQSRYRVPGFSEFIQNVIELFNGQRVERDQFAVLIFTAESKLSRMGKTQFRASWHTTCLVDKTYSYFPHHNLKNYLVARPDKGQHCEEILLNQEYQLWNAYEDHHRTGPKCIILYSWLLPCSDCTTEILTYHTDVRPAVKLIVVFTSEWPYLSKIENQNNITRIQEADIDVHKVSYRRRLPPC